MKILIVNDDGVFSTGTKFLAEIFKDHLTGIVIPEGERSAVSHAITIHQPIFYRKVKNIFSAETYAISGTPADCVKVGVNYFFPETDIVISGINNGYNLGTDIHYSGTVSAALEGVFAGKLSFAFSTAPDNPYIFKYKEIIKKLVFKFAKNSEILKLKNEFLININLPECFPPKGIKSAKVNYTRYNDKVIKYTSPSGKEYLWIGGEINQSDENFLSDFHLIQAGYISISLISVRFNIFECQDKLINSIIL